MKISIIIPLIDRRNAGWRALESAVDQDFPRDQIVLAYENAGWRVFAVSAQAGAGLSPLRQAIWKFFVRPEDQPEG